MRFDSGHVHGVGQAAFRTSEPDRLTHDIHGTDTQRERVSFGAANQFSRRWGMLFGRYLSDSALWMLNGHITDLDMMLKMTGATDQHEAFAGENLLQAQTERMDSKALLDKRTTLVDVRHFRGSEKQPGQAQQRQRPDAIG